MLPLACLRVLLSCGLSRVLRFLSVGSLITEFYFCLALAAISLQSALPMIDHSCRIDNAPDFSQIDCLRRQCLCDSLASKMFEYSQ
jgi:hypothetical protein